MSGAQPLDTSTATGMLMLSVIGAVGQAEREATLERQREGIANPKRPNKGRVPAAKRQTGESDCTREAGRQRPTEPA